MRSKFECMVGQARWLVVGAAFALAGCAGTIKQDARVQGDPAERGLKRCRDAGRSGCAVYAVDDRVVYVRPVQAAQR